MRFSDATVVVTWLTPFIVGFCMWLSCRHAYRNGVRRGREDHVRKQIAEESFAIMKANGIPHEIAKKLANFPEDIE